MQNTITLSLIILSYEHPNCVYIFFFATHRIYHGMQDCQTFIQRPLYTAILVMRPRKPRNRNFCVITKRIPRCRANPASLRLPNICGKTTAPLSIIIKSVTAPCHFVSAATQKTPWKIQLWNYCTLAILLKAKGVHNTHMVAQGGEKVWYGSYSFTISTLDGVNGQGHAPAALNTRGKDPRYPLDRKLGVPQSWSGHRC
jgi:hypothetical protein